MSEDTLGRIIWVFCVGGCAILFDIIAYCFSKKEEPCSIYSGKTVDKNTVKDVVGYNKAVAKILYKYSIPYYLSGVLYFFFVVLAVVILVLWATSGVFYIIYEYKKVEKEFIFKGEL